ncbi:MAG: hypothetical protein D6820_14855, partial [Lentisphaerae bacterium]
MLLSPDPSSMRTRLRRFWQRSPCTVLFLGICLLWLEFALVSLPDYGLTWDEPWELLYGDRLLHFLWSWDWSCFDFTTARLESYHAPQQPDLFRAVNMFADNDLRRAPYLIWPLPSLLAALSHGLFSVAIPLLPGIEAYHLAPVIGGLLTIVVCWYFTRQLFGSFTACVAALFLALSPRWFAHSHFNHKDVWTTFFFTWSGFRLLQLILAQKRPSVKTAAVTGGILGLGLACKPNLLFLGPVLLPVVIADLLASDSRLRSWGWRYSLTMVMILGLCSMIGMLLFWPLLLRNFPDNLIAYGMSIWERGHTSGGLSFASHWRALYLFWATQPPFSLLAMVAAIPMCWRMLRLRRQLRLPALFVLSWFTVTLLRVSLPGARDFDGIRHWLEILPAAAILGGLGIDYLFLWMWRFKSRLARPVSSRVSLLIAFFLCLAGLLPTAVYAWRIHPHQIVYFNKVSGGIHWAAKHF